MPVSTVIPVNTVDPQRPVAADLPVRRVAASDPALLFDEAEALGGRRTEIRDATDRYANLETTTDPDDEAAG